MVDTISSERFYMVFSAVCLCLFLISIFLSISVFHTSILPYMVLACYFVGSLIIFCFIYSTKKGGVS